MTMPRLSLYRPEKGNDYKFIDKNIGECKFKRAEEIESCCIENPNTKYKITYKQYKYIPKLECIYEESYLHDCNV